MKSLASRRQSDNPKINREHYVAAILVLIILVYASCHSIRRVLHYCRRIRKNTSLLQTALGIFYNIFLFCLDVISTWLSCWPLLEVNATRKTSDKYKTDLSGSTQQADFSSRMMIATAVSHLLITFNSSINFAIYCIKVRRSSLCSIICHLAYWDPQQSWIPVSLKSNGPIH